MALTDEELLRFHKVAYDAQKENKPCFARPEVVLELLGMIARLREERREAYRRGQEDMRERAAHITQPIIGELRGEAYRVRMLAAEDIRGLAIAADLSKAGTDG